MSAVSLSSSFQSIRRTDRVNASRNRAQDLEYKLSGLQRAFAGKVGSATFPHGAISLWDREFFIRTFHDHPGFSVSEDWFFGDSCRSLGGRIIMCTSIFVETETPSAIFWNRKGGSRGGFGEMTVFKQRFMRWNFFFVAGIWYNMAYIFSSWKLGWWEIGAKIFVFQEVRLNQSFIPQRYLHGRKRSTNPCSIFWHHSCCLYLSSSAPLSVATFLLQLLSSTLSTF